MIRTRKVRGVAFGAPPTGQARGRGQAASRDVKRVGVASQAAVGIGDGDGEKIAAVGFRRARQNA